MAASLGELIVTVGAQISGFTDAMTSVSSQLGALGETAATSLEHFDGIIEGFGEVAAAAGIATGAFEIAKEALENFSKAQDLQTSFALLTGSAEEAENAFELLKTTAVDLAVPFESLVSVAQRLAPQFGVGTQQLTDVLKAAGDAAAATGRDFQTIADGLDRIAVTGQVSTRQMVQFGVSMQDIADAMGVSVSTAIDKLKKGGQDAQADVEAVVTAIENKFGGAAELIAQNLSGQFTNLKNQLSFISEDLGAALAPLAGDLISGLKDIEPTLKGIAEGVVPAAEGFKNLAISVSALTPDFLKIVLSAPSMVALGTAFGFVADAAGAFVDVLHGAVLLMTDAVAALNPFSDGLKKFKQDWIDLGNTLYADLSTKFQATADAGQKAADALHETSFAVKIDPAPIEQASAAIYSLSDAFKDLGVKIPPTQAEFDKLADAMIFIRAQFDAGKISSQTYGAAIDDFVKKMNSLQGAFVAASQPVDLLGQALKLAGIKDVTDDLARLQAGVEAAGEAYSIGRISAGQYADEITKLDAAAEKSATDGLPGLITQLKIAEQDFADFGDTPKALAAALDAVVQATPGFQESVMKQDDAIGHLLITFNNINQEAPTVAQTLKSFGVDTADDVAARVKHLQDALDAANAALKIGVPGAALAAQLALQSLRQEQEKLSDERLDDAILGIPNLTNLQNKLSDVNRAYQDLSDKGLLNATTALQASVVQQRAAIDVAVQQGQDTTNLRIDLDATTEALKRQTLGFSDMAAALKGIELGGIQSAAHDLLFDIGNIGDAFKKMGESIVDTVLNRIIKDAMSPLLDSLDKVIASATKALEQVLGIGGSGGGVLGTGGIPGVYKPTISDIPGLPGPSGAGIPGVGGQPGIDTGAGGATGSLGSIADIAGIAGAIAAIGSGIVSGLQGATTNDHLFHIMNDTARMELILGGNGAESLFGYTGIIKNSMAYLPTMQGALNDIRASSTNSEGHLLDILKQIVGVGTAPTAAVKQAGVIPAPTTAVSFDLSPLHIDLTAIENTLISMRDATATFANAFTSKMMTVANAGAQTINFTINGVSDPQAVAQAVAQYLKTANPSFV